MMSLSIYRGFLDMGKRFKVFLIVTGTALMLLSGMLFLMILGAVSYTSRCAHIRDKSGVFCEVGGTLYIDDLADFSNYDERGINGIADGEGIISEDRCSITITGADSFVTVYVYAFNDNAPEQTTRTVKVMIKGD